MFVTPSKSAKPAFYLAILFALFNSTAWSAERVELSDAEPGRLRAIEPEPEITWYQPVRKSLDLISTAFQGGVEFSLFEVPSRLTMSARTTRALLYGDNGSDQELFLVANSYSSTRITALLEMMLNESWQTGFSLKIPLLLDSSASIDFGDSGGGFSLGQFDNEREWDLYIQSSDYGELHLGYGPTASDGSSEVDLSGTKVIASSKSRNMAGGLSFNNAGPQIKDVFNNFDGLGDRGRVRYDTPDVQGVVASTSVTVEGDFDFALNYQTAMNERSMAVGVAYAHIHAQAGRHQFSSSASLLDANGISTTVAAAVRFGNGSSIPFLLYSKLAYRKRFFSVGESLFGIDFSYNHSVNFGGNHAINYGVFAVQNFEVGGFLESADLYLSLRNHHLWRISQARELNDDPFDVVPQSQPLFATMAGFRLQF